jgi:glycosyltransferase involved in cell wall biosynthesis
MGEENLLKVLRVTSDLYPEVVGGLPIHAHHLSQELSRKGCHTTVLTCTNSNRKFGEGNGYTIVFQKTIFALLGNSFSISIFGTLLNIRNNYDIIHAHGHLFFSTNIASLIRKIGSPPLIITTHGIMSASAPNWINMLYMKTIGKWTLQSADKIICYTQNEKEILSKLLNLDLKKICVIPNGVDTNLFHPENKKHNNQTNTVTILWVGRFVRGKGVEYIIQAAKIIVKEVPNLNILLVGDGPLKDEIESLIEKYNLKKYVKIKENVPNENMSEIYQKSDIFVLPSLNEGVPKTLLEAMACGKPVVISEFPHLREIVNNAGLTFPKGDISAFVANIMKLINNRELSEKLGNNGRIKILRDYSWENTVHKTMELYEEVMEKRTF